MGKLLPGGPINAQNNSSHAYLKSIDHEWTYERNKVHPKLLENLHKRIDKLDLGGKNKVMLKQVLFSPDRMKQLVRASDEDVEKMRKAIRIFFGACGVTEKGLGREDWVEAHQVFAEAEREKRKRGEQSLIAESTNVFFDVLDTNGDGTVGLIELKTLMRAFQVPQEAACTFFDAAAVDMSDRLERNEIHDLLHKFWLEPHDPEDKPICVN
jgi:hypothetical protein